MFSEHIVFHIETSFESSHSSLKISESKNMEVNIESINRPTCKETVAFASQKPSTKIIGWAKRVDGRSSTG